MQVARERILLLGQIQYRDPSAAAALFGVQRPPTRRPRSRQQAGRTAASPCTVSTPRENSEAAWPHCEERRPAAGGEACNLLAAVQDKFFGREGTGPASAFKFSFSAPPSSPRCSSLNSHYQIHYQRPHRGHRFVESALSARTLSKALTRAIAPSTQTQRCGGLDWRA
jgi:hypothetical protein